MAVINSIPFEIIAKIFETCVHSCDIPPETLCSINERLREISMQTSVLWSNIVYSTEADIARFDVYIERSDPRPFDVTFHFLPESQTDSGSDVQTLARLVKPHVNRLRSLKATDRSPGDNWFPSDPLHSVLDYEPFFRAFNFPAPNLTTLDLHLGAPSIPGAFLSSQVPRLRDLSSRNCCPNWTFMQSIAGLQSLSIAMGLEPALGHGTRSLADILQTQTSLVELDLRLGSNFISEVPTQFEKSTLVELPHLRSFTYLGAFEPLQHLTFPSIEVFSINAEQKFTGRVTTSHPRDLVMFLKRHSDTLCDVEIGDHAFIKIEGSIIESFNEFPKLARFSMDAAPPLASVLSLIFAPSIKDIEIRMFNETHFSLFHDFIRRNSPNLRNLRITRAVCWSQSAEPGMALSFEEQQELAFSFPVLETYVSTLRRGDVLMSVVQDAPQLRVLELEGSPREHDFEPLPDDHVKLKLPSLISLRFTEYSQMIRRLDAPKLEHLVIESLILSETSLEEDTSDFRWNGWTGRTAPLDETMREQARRMALDFIYRHSSTLISLQCYEPIGSSDTPLHVQFPCLQNAVLNSDDPISTSLCAPVIETLELRPALSPSAKPSALFGFRNVQSLVVDSNSLSPLVLHSLKNLRRLVLLVDPIFGDRPALSKLLLSLGSPSSPGEEPDAQTEWLCPLLEDIEIRLIELAEISGLLVPGRRPDDDENDGDYKYSARSSDYSSDFTDSDSNENKASEGDSDEQGNNGQEEKRENDGEAEASDKNKGEGPSDGPVLEMRHHGSSSPSEPTEEEEDDDDAEEEKEKEENEEEGEEEEKEGEDDGEIENDGENQGEGTSGGLVPETQPHSPDPPSGSIGEEEEEKHDNGGEAEDATNNKGKGVMGGHIPEAQSHNPSSPPPNPAEDAVSGSASDTSEPWPSFVDLGALRSTIQARRNNMQVSPIRRLVLSKGPRVWHGFGLSGEQKAWFDSNVEEFAGA